MTETIECITQVFRGIGKLGGDELGIKIGSRVVFVPAFTHFEGEDRWFLSLRLLLPLGG